MKLESAAARDAWIAVCAVFVGGFSCVQLDTAERLSASVLRWERIQLDDLLLTAGLAVCATSWFAVRRWREARRSLDAHRESEREKAHYVAKLEELSAQLLWTEQAERTRIAELLHDSIGQTLYACRLQIEHAQNRAHDAELRALLGEAVELSAEALASARDLTNQLDPPILRDLGLADAIEWLLSQTERRFGLKTSFVPGDAWQHVPTQHHGPVFQSVRELIANAVRHASASELSVSAAISGDGSLTIAVHDDGCGLDARRPSEGAGFGLFSIERRMACLGATFQIASHGARGTRACLQLPAAGVRSV